MWSASGPAGGDFCAWIGPRGEPYPHLLLSLVALVTGGMRINIQRLMHGGFASLIADGWGTAMGEAWKGIHHPAYKDYW